MPLKCKSLNLSFPSLPRKSRRAVHLMGPSLASGSTRSRMQSTGFSGATIVGKSGILKLLKNARVLARIDTASPIMLGPCDGWRNPTLTDGRNPDVHAEIKRVWQLAGTPHACGSSRRPTPSVLRRGPLGIPRATPARCPSDGAAATPSALARCIKPRGVRRSMAHCRLAGQQPRRPPMAIARMPRLAASAVGAARACATLPSRRVIATGAMLPAAKR